MFVLRNQTVSGSSRSPAAKPIRFLKGAWPEVTLLLLMAVTGLVVLFKDEVLERSLRITPQTVQSLPHAAASDTVVGGDSVAIETRPLAWTCDIRGGSGFPYCNYEIYFDKDKGSKGIDLTNMRGVSIAMVYHGSATTYRAYLKNFNPAYAGVTIDKSPKPMRVEPKAVAGVPHTSELIMADFAVPDWWLRQRDLPPEFGRPEFSNITSLNFETASNAAVGRHTFEIREIVIRTAALTDAQFYALLLGSWIVIIAAYLAARLQSLRKAARERRLQEERMLNEARETARRDPLTGLLNRRGLMERYEDLMRQKPDTTGVAVILLDVDHFKRLNDTYGHSAGDTVLAEMARVVSSNIRSADLAARWGGEEFIVACADVDRRGAYRIAQKLREQIAAASFGACGQVTASFGVSFATGAGADLNDLVKLADTALYEAKAEGRNRCKLNKDVLARAA
jgi:diguanylate cyclase (GGDEF)-like protein